MESYSFSEVVDYFRDVGCHISNFTSCSELLCGNFKVGWVSVENLLEHDDSLSSFIVENKSTSFGFDYYSVPIVVDGAGYKVFEGYERVLMHVQFNDAFILAFILYD